MSKRSPETKEKAFKKATDNMKRWKSSEYKASALDAIDIFLTGWFQPVFEIVSLPTHTRVMEVGVGGGKWSAVFSLLGCKSFIVDNDPEMLIQAQSNFPYMGFTPILDDAIVLDKVGNKSMDIVFSDGLIEHFLDKETREKVIENFIKKSKFVVIYTVPIDSNEIDEVKYKDQEDVLKEAEDVVKKVYADFDGKVLGYPLNVTHPDGSNRKWIMVFIFLI